MDIVILTRLALSSIHCDIVILIKLLDHSTVQMNEHLNLNLPFYITRWSHQLYLPITIMDTGTASIIPKQIVHPTFK